MQCQQVAECYSNKVLLPVISHVRLTSKTKDIQQNISIKHVSWFIQAENLLADGSINDTKHHVWGSTTMLRHQRRLSLKQTSHLKPASHNTQYGHSHMIQHSGKKFVNNYELLQLHRIMKWVHSWTLHQLQTYVCLSK